MDFWYRYAGLVIIYHVECLLMHAVRFRVKVMVSVRISGCIVVMHTYLYYSLLSLSLSSDIYSKFN